MDIVYLVRRGERNEELRFSLRSLANLPHDRVWLAGYKPSWVRAGFIEAPRARGGSYEQTTLNLRAAAEHPEVSEDFLLFNDDFFVMRPTPVMPVLHRGIVSPVVPKGVTLYTQQLHRLAGWLRDRGVDPVFSYELHLPMELTKSNVRDMFDLDVPTQAFHRHKRTLYGNTFDVGGTLMHDVKIRDKAANLDRRFLSTNDALFARGEVGRYIRERFPELSPYEESDDLHDGRVRGDLGRHVPRRVEHPTPDRLAG